MSLIFVLNAASVLASGAQPDKPSGQTGEEIVFTSDDRPEGAKYYEVWPTLTQYTADTGRKITEFGEAPEHAEMVAAGTLRPVEERLPDDPMVVRGFDGRIGTYGGSLSTGSSWDWRFWQLQGYDYMPIQGQYPFGERYPNSIESFTMNDDGTVWEYTLRKGMKWDDGDDLTADDFLFTFNDIYMNTNIYPELPGELLFEGRKAKIEKINDYALRYTFPRTLDLRNMDPWFWQWVFPTAIHYWEKFHADYVDDVDALNDMAKERGMENWTQFFGWQFFAQVVGAPTLDPFYMTQGMPDTPTLYKRNPFYWQIDEMGNQLPYLEGLVYETLDESVVHLRALAGEIDWVGLPITLFDQVKEAEEKGIVKIKQEGGPDINTDSIMFNLTTFDPVKRKIFQDKRFRFAISHAVDRELYSQTFHLGLAKPWQVAPFPSSPFYHEELPFIALEYDLDKANALLDEIGLDKRGSDGFRLTPDGESLVINFVSEAGIVDPEAELFTEFIEAVGLKTTLRFISPQTMGDVWRSNEFDGTFIWGSWGTIEGQYMQNNASHFTVNPHLAMQWAPLWKQWYATGGKEGEEPIPIIKEVMEHYNKAKGTLDLEQQKFWFGKVLDIAAENLWTIGTCDRSPGVSVVPPNIVNMPLTPFPWSRGDAGRMGIFFREEQ